MSTPHSEDRHACSNLVAISGLRICSGGDLDVRVESVPHVRTSARRWRAASYGAGWEPSTGASASQRDRGDALPPSHNLTTLIPEDRDAADRGSSCTKEQRAW